MHSSLVPVRTNADKLARELKQRGLPGRCSAATIRRKWRDRVTARTAPGPQRETAPARLRRKLVARAEAEIARRGGETVIEGNYREVGLSLADRDPSSRIVLVNAHGWRQYSRSFGARRASLAYLYGVDDAGEWAVRVPGTIESVAEGLAWLEPAEVTRARQAGRRVRRQGDMYAVETTADCDGTGPLPEGHRWNPNTRYLTHQPQHGGGKHRPLKLSFPVRFVGQRAYGMGRGAGRGCGD